MVWDVIASVIGGLVAEIIVRYNSWQEKEEALAIPSPGEILKVERPRNGTPTQSEIRQPNQEEETFKMVVLDLFLHIISVFALYQAFMLPLFLTGGYIDEARWIGWLLPHVEVGLLSGWMMLIVLPVYFLWLKVSEDVASFMGYLMDQMIDFSWVRYRAVTSLVYFFMCFLTALFVGYLFSGVTLLGGFLTACGLLFFMSSFMTTLVAE